MQTYNLLKFALARSNVSSFLLITQYEMPFINKSKAAKRPKDRKIKDKCTNGTSRRSRVWAVCFIYIVREIACFVHLEFRILAFQNLEFKILAVQNLEFRILAVQNLEFRILAVQNLELLNSGFWQSKILNSRFWQSKLLNSGFWQYKIFNSEFWQCKILNSGFWHSFTLKGTATPTKESLYIAGYNICNNVSFNFFFFQRSV